MLSFAARAETECPRRGSKSTEKADTDQCDCPVTWEPSHIITMPPEPCPPASLKTLFFFKEIKESKGQNASSVRTFPYLPMARWMLQKALLFSYLRCSYFFRPQLLGFISSVHITCCGNCCIILCFVRSSSLPVSAYCINSSFDNSFFKGCISGWWVNSRQSIGFCQFASSRVLD